MQIKNLIEKAILNAVNSAINAGIFTIADDSKLPDILLEVPPKKEFGDFASNFAMQSAKVLHTNPRKIAEEIKSRIEAEQALHDIKGNQIEWLDKIEIAGAGFMNFYLKPTVIYDTFKQIFYAGENYGQLPNKGNVPIQVEYISANPTGLLHVGHGRGAAAGSAIVNIMRAAGYNVESEYYINDSGNQMDMLGQSVNARYLELLGQPFEFPEKGYKGVDVIDTTKKIIERDGDKYLKLDEAERMKVLLDLAYEDKLNEIKKDLANFRVKIDKYFSERTLHPNAVNEAIEVLKSNGTIYEKDGALWLKSTDYGDDKDRVVVRDNGEPTYLAADIAYHKNKFDRGFGELINLWGADHHGYICRVKASLQALGYNPDKLKILILQMVALYRSGELVKMSKRTGESITLRELMEEVGTDAARYFFLMRSMDSQLDFDLDLAKKKSNDNPVYYIQYAHARICSIFRQTEELNMKMSEAPNFNLLNHPSEVDLINKIIDYEEEIDKAAIEYAPQKIARYAHELAALFHAFYRDCRIIGVHEELASARLALVKVTAHVIEHSLGLLGVSAPESM